MENKENDIVSRKKQLEIEVNEAHRLVKSLETEILKGDYSLSSIKEIIEDHRKNPEYKSMAIIFRIFLYFLSLALILGQIFITSITFSAIIWSILLFHCPLIAESINAMKERKKDKERYNDYLNKKSTLNILLNQLDIINDMELKLTKNDKISITNDIDKKNDYNNTINMYDQYEPFYPKESSFIRKRKLD